MIIKIVLHFTKMLLKTFKLNQKHNIIPKITFVF